MDNKNIEKLLHSFSAGILEYEDGDLMLMSDLIDTINIISKEFESIKKMAVFFESIQCLLKFLLDGGEYRFVDDLVSQGIDLLARIIRDIQRNKILLNKTTATLPLLKNYEEEIVQFTETAGHRINAALQSKTSEGIVPTGVKELELRIASEPFKVFLSEANEKIIQAQDLILKLEEDTKNKNIVNDLFRIFHTIKGECGFLRISSLGELAHNLENLLDLMREGKILVNADLIDLLLSGIDYTRHMIDTLHSGEIVIFSNINVDDFIEKVNEQVHSIKNNIGEILLAKGKISEADVVAILQKQKELSFTRKFGEIAIDEKYISAEDLEDSLHAQTTKVVKERGEEKKTDSIIKVKASQITYLVDMVGELLITEAQLDEKTQNLTQLNKITREIQYAAMQLRTEKVKNLLIIMKRLVRDVSKKLKKPATVQVRGEDLEIDRDLVEKLEEPLMHIIRNAIAHGIEPEQDRLKAGKPVEGKISIEAERRGNTIVISVEDDGRGLDREKILQQAVKKKIVSKEDASRLSDYDIYNYIFEQGFSTAEAVDSVSGRGVGMDIVKTVTASARGRVELKTETGKNTRIEMIFPLSTAIIDGMIVKNKGTHFIIPVSNIIESLNLENEKIYSVQNNTEVIDMRGEIIPLISLEDYFAQENMFNEKGTGRILAVIVENNEKKKYALLLDDIVTKREVFIKSLGSKFRDLRGISSGTILQGGKIGFVLDIDQISKGVDFTADKHMAGVS